MAMTAEELMTHLEVMPVSERARFFAMVGQLAFRDRSYTHEEVFGHLADARFTAAEAAEYLEVSMATFRRLVRDGKIVAANEIGRSQLFSAPALQAFKRQRKAVKG